MAWPLAKGGKVNLLPAKEKLEQNLSFLNSLFKIAFPFILVLSLLYFILDSAENGRYKKLIIETQGQIKQLEPHSRRAREYLELKTKLEQRKRVLETASGRQPFWFGIFKELSSITPQRGHPAPGIHCRGENPRGHKAGGQDLLQIHHCRPGTVPVYNEPGGFAVFQQYPVFQRAGYVFSGAGGGF